MKIPAIYDSDIKCYIVGFYWFPISPSSGYVVAIVVFPDLTEESGGMMYNVPMDDLVVDMDAFGE